VETEKLSPDSRGKRGCRSGHTEPARKALRRIRRTREFPAISKYVLEINKKLQDTSVHASASELANVILKDYALTNKLLKLVNSAFYGLAAGKVTTVSRAVVLLGHDNVRMAAISLVLFEHFQSRTAAKDLKEEILRSFWCGLLAKKIAETCRGVDPEEAFICGLLHRLGKLLAIYHMDHDYRKIQYHVTQKGEDEERAVKRILGLSYQALGMAAAEDWNFPESICNSMAAVSHNELKDTDQRIDPLRGITTFSARIGRIVMTLKPARHKAAIEKLLQDYHHCISLSFRQIRTMMADCLDQLYRHADALQFDVERSLFLAQFCVESGEGSAAKKKGGAGCPVAAPAPAYQLLGDEDLKAQAQHLANQDAVEIIMGGIQEVSYSMVAQFDINDIALMSLEVLYRALDCNRAILFINDRRNNMLQARFGYGKNIEKITGKIEFELTLSDDLFNQAIAAEKDLLVEDTYDPALYPLIPDWYRNSIDAHAFIFLPVSYKQICVGALYADMEAAGTPVNAVEHRYLAILRNQMVLAFKLGR
jgi:HD-like signal output (HDOD) protein